MEVGFEDILNVGRLSEANFAPKETNDPKLSDRMGMVVMHSVELEELMKNGAYHRVALLPHIPPSKFDEDGCKEKCSQRCSSMK